MKKSDIPESAKVYISLAVLFVLLLLIMPRTGKFNYDYRKGAPWSYETLVAEFDFPILKTEEQLRSEMEAAGSTVVPYYRCSEEAAAQVRAFAEEAELSRFRPAVLSALEDIYDRGVLDGKEPAEEAADVIFIQKDKRAFKCPRTEVHTLSSARAVLTAAVPAGDGDSLLHASGLPDRLLPNLIYDREMTGQVHAESVNFISPTQGFVNSGQTIVSKGELVTAEIGQLLDSYKAEYEHSLGYSGPVLSLWLGNAILAAVICFILFFSIIYTNPDIFGSFRKYLYIMFLVTVTAIVAIAVERISPKLLYMVPFSIFALYLLAFFSRRVVLPVYIVSLFPLLLYAQDGIVLFTMNVVAGVLAIYVFRFFSRGWRQFVWASIVFAAMALTWIGFGLTNDFHSMHDWTKLLYLFIGSLLSVAGYPLIFLFEKLFGLLSGTRLMELCDTTNNRLLKELAQKAPGTFQHSLQVMNMCDAAAESIGADVPLVRAGALYHDIGKMTNPSCFVENESLGRDYHKGLTAVESADAIRRHVDEGRTLAEKYNLPQEVEDFILTHHGTTAVGYFYTQYLNEGGDPADRAKFVYSGFKPRTKEQFILMVCDTLEAASRTLKDTSPAAFDAFVDKMVAGKAAEGQFDECDVTLKEIHTVKEVLKTYLVQIHHERVVYPATVVRTESAG